MYLFKESLPENTLILFDQLFNNEIMKETGGVLMGGTALSLQINHRKSEDLDFSYFSEQLPTSIIDQLIIDLKSKGFSVINTLSQSAQSQARINGYFLQDYIREYSINNVNINFFIMNKGGPSRWRYFKAAPTINAGGAFGILNLTSLFESKSVVLMDRVKSRDLFDLMVLIKKYNYQVSDIIDAIRKIDNKDDREARVALEILIGNIPLDKNDPGFESLSLKVDINDIYNFFKEPVNEYEQNIAVKQLEK